MLCTAHLKGNADQGYVVEIPATAEADYTDKNQYDPPASVPIREICGLKIRHLRLRYTRRDEG